MKYHIQTIPIWDAFKSADNCPLCSISRVNEDRILQTYVSDKVMSPEFRSIVNARGFCEKHAARLLDGGNKLGFALQCETRAKWLSERVKPVNGARNAKKLADALNKCFDCVVCDELYSTMERYFYTIAQMYFFESEFPALFKKAHICMPHCIRLLQYCDYAKNKETEFASAITFKLRTQLENVASDLRDFADGFDYKSKTKVTDRKTPVKACALLYGDDFNNKDD